jgi:hypothetical protein
LTLNQTTQVSDLTAALTNESISVSIALAAEQSSSTLPALTLYVRVCVCVCVCVCVVSCLHASMWCVRLRVVHAVCLSLRSIVNNRLLIDNGTFESFCERLLSHELDALIDAQLRSTSSSSTSLTRHARVRNAVIVRRYAMTPPIFAIVSRQRSLTLSFIRAAQLFRDSSRGARYVIDTLVKHSRATN